jgi:hypothetical protein
MEGVGGIAMTVVTTTHHPSTVVFTGADDYFPKTVPDDDAEQLIISSRQQQQQQPVIDRTKSLRTLILLRRFSTRVRPSRAAETAEKGWAETEEAQAEEEDARRRYHRSKSKFRQLLQVAGEQFSEVEELVQRVGPKVRAHVSFCAAACASNQNHCFTHQSIDDFSCLGFWNLLIIYPERLE